MRNPSPVPQACAACASVSCVHLPARCADPNMGNTPSSPPPPSPPSPSGFSFHYSPKSWHAARQDCQSRGGDLASIHSEAEHREAFALTGGRDAWIGLNDEEDEGNHVWSDGTPMDYHGWSGYPASPPLPPLPPPPPSPPPLPPPLIDSGHAH